MGKQAIGVVGLAVMGRNLALNIESRGHAVSVYNRSREKTDELIAEYPDKKLVPAFTLLVWRSEEKGQPAARDLPPVARRLRRRAA